jgi:hypothetical protein
MIIYWETSAKTQDKATIRFIFPDKSQHDFVVPTFKFLDHSVEELEKRGMSILLPFCILKPRKEVVRTKSAKRRSELSLEVRDTLEEICLSLNRSVKNGIINTEDMYLSMELTGVLYDALYGKYPEFKETKEMAEKLMVLPSERVAKKVAKQTREKVTLEVTARVEKQTAERVTREIMEKAAKQTEERVVKEAKEIAFNLIEMGVDIDKIVKATKLSRATVEELSNEKKPRRRRENS